MKKVLIIILIIAILGGGFFVIKNRFLSSKTSAEMTEVKVQKVETGNIITRVNADGTVELSKKEIVKTKIDGVISNINIEEGVNVKKDQIIICLKDSLIKDEVESVRISLKEARASYERILNTYNKQENINNLKLKDAERNLEIAKLSLEKEKLSLEEKRKNLEKRLSDSEDSFEKLEEEVKEKKYLYDNGAIPEKTLVDSKDKYEKAKKEYKDVKENLNIFIEKTVPNNLRLARLQVENAKNKLELLKASTGENEITDNELESARLKIARYKKQYNELQNDLKNVVVKSPISGTVIKVNVKKNDKVLQGNTLAVIANLNNIIIEALVDEIDVNNVNIGQKVIISSDAFNEEIDGEVINIAPTGEKVGNINKYRTKIKIVNNKEVLRPGMFVNTEITTQKKENVIVIPSLAVRGEGKKKHVFIAEDGIAKKRFIDTGLKNISKVEVNGIKNGEKIIVGPFNILKNLKDGQSIVNINKEQKK